MYEFMEKFKISYLYINRVLFELIMDLFFYYTSSYPLLLITGAFRRIKRRIKYLWFPKGPGRPPIPENIVDLILDMKRSNLLWGALRISQELRLMGIKLHKKTISKILKENGLTTPPMKFHPPTWEALLASGYEIWAMDFCNVIDMKLFQIYILGIININSRELITISVTCHPNRDWLLQQLRNLSIDETQFPKYLIIDNDAIYGKWIDPVMKDFFEIQIIRISHQSPWQNGFFERFWRSLQRECIYRLHIPNEVSVRYFCNKYKKYYNEKRPHQGINGATPIENSRIVSEVTNLHDLKYKKTRLVHGLFTEFSLVA